MAAPSTAAASAVRLSIGAHRLQSKASLVFSLRPFAPKHRSLSFASKRHILTCTALYQPELIIKEEGQPETLDYRVFSQDPSGKKIEPTAAAAMRRAAKKEKATTSPRGYKINPHEILKYPLSTESAVKSIEENNTYIFVVAKQADKKMIRAAMENLYGIKVLSVNTSITPKGTKKAFLKLSSRLELSL